MKLWIITLALLSTIAIAQAHAQAQDALGTGDAYLQTCERPAGPQAVIACRVYARGMHDMVMLLESLGDLKGEICPPKDGPTYEEIQDMMVTYIRAHPQVARPGGGYESTGVYWFAMLDRYPCLKGPRMAGPRP